MTVNGEVVSENRSAFRKGTHQFRIGYKCYKLTFRVMSYITREIVCVVEESGAVVKELMADPKIYEVNATDLVIVLVFIVLHHVLVGYYGISAFDWLLFSGIGISIGLLFFNTSVEVVETEEA